MTKKPNNKKEGTLKGVATANNVKYWGSEGKIKIVIRYLKEMFVERGQKSGIENGQKPAEFSVFHKQHGIAYGYFVIKKEQK